MNNGKSCATCGRSDCRLYRYYEPTGHRDDKNIRCNIHVPADKDWWVPCVTRDDGAILATFPAPGSGTAKFFDAWWAMAEADPGGWTRPMDGSERQAAS